ncbi:MAG: DinB family protein [Flavobacteriales bacterium]|nr:DinB family protein [Flavobacteriales bacterium]
MDNKDRLLARFNSLERDRRMLLDQLDRHDAGSLARIPRPGAWSVAQVIMHFVLVERGSLAYLMRKLEMGNSGQAGTFSGVRSGLLNLTVGLPLRFKAPPMVAVVPVCSYGDAFEAWAAVRTDLEHSLAALPPALLDHGLFKHPVAGRLTPEQGLRFMAAHHRHHRGQIQRTLASIGRMPPD